MHHLEEAMKEEKLELPQLCVEGIERQPTGDAGAGVSIHSSVRRKLQLYQRRGSAMAQIADVPVRMSLHEAHGCQRRALTLQIHGLWCHSEVHITTISSMRLRRN